MNVIEYGSKLQHDIRLNKIEQMREFIKANTFDDCYTSFLTYICSSEDIVNFVMDNTYFTETTKDGYEVQFYYPTHSDTNCFLVDHFKEDTTIVDQLKGFDYWEKAAARNTFFVEDKKVASISRILGHVFDGEEDFLKAWRERVGEEEARRISEASTRRGTALHTKLEDYLLNNSTDLVFTEEMTTDQKQFEVFIQRLFNQLRPLLSKKVSKIHGMEIPLVSPTLMAGGRLDLLCEYAGKLTLADFKSSDKKISISSDKAKKYFAQMIFYAIILFELTGIQVEQVALLVATEAGTPQELFIAAGSAEWNEIAKDVVKRTADYQPVFEAEEAIRIKKAEEKKLLNEKKQDSSKV